MKTCITNEYKTLDGQKYNLTTVKIDKLPVGMSDTIFYTIRRFTYYKNVGIGLFAVKIKTYNNEETQISRHYLDTINKSNNKVIDLIINTEKIGLLIDEKLINANVIHIKFETNKQGDLTILDLFENVLLFEVYNKDFKVLSDETTIKLEEFKSQITNDCIIIENNSNEKLEIEMFFRSGCNFIEQENNVFFFNQADIFKEYDKSELIFTNTNFNIFHNITSDITSVHEDKFSLSENLKMEFLTNFHPNHAKKVFFSLINMIVDTFLNIIKTDELKVENMLEKGLITQSNYNLLKENNIDDISSMLGMNSEQLYEKFEDDEVVNLIQILIKKINV